MTEELKPTNITDLSSEVYSLKTKPIQTSRTFASLRHRNFQLYFGGQLISVAGTWMQIIAQGWLVYEISHSEIMLGVVAFAAAIPALLITPWGGVVVDRVPKRALLVITQATAMLLAFILAVLAFTGKVQVWHIVLLAVGVGLVNAFDGPARQAFVVEMVGREDLTNAIALNSLMFNSARVVGPAIGGLLLAAVGPAWCFFFNGLSYLAVIAGLMLMRLPPHERKVSAGSPWKELKGGVRYVIEHSELGGIILLALIFSFFGISYGTVLPAFVDQVLHQGAATYGWINAASGLGAVCSALFLANSGDRGQRGRWLAVASLAFPFLLAAFAFNPWLPLSLLLAFGLGVGFMVQFNLFNTLLQLRVTDAMRGRVLSLYTLTFFGFGPFGNLLLGWLAQVLGVSMTLAVFALVALILSRIVFSRIPKIEQLT